MAKPNRNPAEDTLQPLQPPASSGSDTATSQSSQTPRRPSQSSQGPTGGQISPEDLEFFSQKLAQLRQLMHQNIIGQEDLLRHLLLALLGGGHILVEGVPGLAKTLAVRTLAQSLQLDYKRIQFTPDLLPADLIGTMIFHQSKDEFIPRHGPVFTQVLLADEINRAPAKVQSALLEAMGEQQVTLGQTSYPLPHPFFVMATQNPIEEEGTYPLPAAQLDRFDIKYVVHYPSPEEELQLLTQYQNQGLRFLREQKGLPKDSKDPKGSEGSKDPKDSKDPKKEEGGASGEMELLSSEDLLRMRSICSKVKLGEQLVRYIINIVNATRESNKRLEFSRFIDLGASPRASIALCRYAAISALFSQRDYVLPNDVKAVCPAVLRHRLLLSYEAEAENQNSDDVIQQILHSVAVP